MVPRDSILRDHGEALFCFKTCAAKSNLETYVQYGILS